MEESTMNWITQLAVAKVRDKKEPDVEMSDEEREAYERAVDQLELMMEILGPDKFDELEIDVGYNY